MPDSITLQLHPEDMKLLTQLRESPDPVPQDITDSTLLNYLHVASVALQKADEMAAKLKPLLGRILLTIKHRPQIYEALGYRDYSHWMKVGVFEKYHVSRTNAFNYVAIAENLGFLPTQDLEQMDFGMQTQLAQAIKKDIGSDEPVEMVEKKRDYWVAQATAEGSTVQTLKNLIMQKNLADEGEMEPIVYVPVAMTIPAAKLWSEVNKDPEILAFAQIKRKGELFERMLDEVIATWRAQIEDALRAVAKGEPQAG